MGNIDDNWTNNMKKISLTTITLISITASVFMMVASARTDRRQAVVIGTTCADIQNTINNSATNTTVYLNGTYTCDTKLQFNGKAMKLVGTKGTKLVAQGNIGGLVYDYTPNSKVEISGITFDVNNQSNVTGISFGAGNNIYLHDITVTNCKDIWCIRVGDTGAYTALLMEKVTVSSSTNSTYESVLLMNVKNCLVQNNLFTNLTQSPAALALYVGTTNCVIRNNTYANNTIRDFYSSGADHFIYTGNVSNAATSSTITSHGIQLFNTHHAVVSNNYIRGQNDGQSASGGIIIYDYKVGLDGHDTAFWATSTDIYIENNTFDRSYSAISIPCVSGDDKHYEKNNFFIRNNTIIDPLWKAIDIGCPEKGSKMTNIELSGNKVLGVTKVFTAGNFSLTGASSTDITNVLIKNNTGLRSSAGGDSSCIFIKGASNVTLQGNQCTGVGKGAFSDIQVDASSTSNIIK